MKNIFGIGNLTIKPHKTLLAIGAFDGIHRGHQFLIKKMVGRAKAIGAQSIVMTFFPHPSHVISPAQSVPFLISLHHRIKLIKELGVDICLVIRFTKALSRLKPIEFENKFILNRINPLEIYVGHDFHYGNKRAGNIKTLQDYGKAHNCQVHVISPRKINGRIISSSLIREFIARGEIKNATHFLGRHVSIYGKVMRGRRRGQTLGFPTANIIPHSRMILPFGVYVTKVLIGERMYFGMANVGRKPTFQRRGNLSVEVHIFDFHQKIYNMEIEVIFLHKLRNERKFSYPALLVAQLHKDKLNAKSFLVKYTSP